jgi:D-3-phosphoglycerate dehydrogenase
MGVLVVATDPRHTDFSIEREELASVGAELKVEMCETEEAVIERCKNADALLVTFAPLTRRSMAGLNRCGIIVRTGVGYDTIDVPAATERGIMVANVPDYCIAEVADHAMALMLCMVRRICELDAQVRAQGWVRPTTPVPRLEGRTLGIVGLGRIGRAVAARARGFGLRLIGADPYVTPEVFAAYSTATVSLPQLLGAADIVTLHTPLTQETRGLIRADTLRHVKPTALLVNTSRGGVVVTDDLVSALQEGTLAGAALDVFEEEPLPTDHPIRNLPNVLLTPHAAWYSVQAEPDLRRRSAQIIARALQGEIPASLLNPEVLRPRA